MRKMYQNRYKYQFQLTTPISAKAGHCPWAVIGLLMTACKLMASGKAQTTFSNAST